MNRSLSLLMVAMLVAGCYGDMVSMAEALPGFEGTPIDPALELACSEPGQSAEDGHHYPGNACLGCHNGSLGPSFSAGGTLFADAEGAMPLAGINIQMIDASSTRVDLVTAANGNFYTSAAITFPVTVYASACPDVVPMPILSPAGDCNSCHAAGQRTAFSP